VDNTAQEQGAWPESRKGGGGRITGSIEQRADISMVIWGQNEIVSANMYIGIAMITDLIKS